MVVLQCFQNPSNPMFTLILLHRFFGWNKTKGCRISQILYDVAVSNIANIVNSLWIANGYPKKCPTLNRDIYSQTSDWYSHVWRIQFWRFHQRTFYDPSLPSKFRMVTLLNRQWSRCFYHPVLGAVPCTSTIGCTLNRYGPTSFKYLPQIDELEQINHPKPCNKSQKQWDFVWFRPQRDVGVLGLSPFAKAPRRVASWLLDTPAEHPTAGTRWARSAAPASGAPNAAATWSWVRSVG